MKNVNYSLVNENESNVFANLVSGATAKTLESVTFIDKDTETTIAVKYDIESLPSYKELQNFGIETFAYCSKVGTGKKTFILAKRKSDNITVFADIETLRKSFGISYNMKINNVTELHKVCNNFAKAFGFEFVEGANGIFVGEDGKEHFLIEFAGDFSIFEKQEKQSTKAQLEAANAKNAALEAELLALKKQLGLI